tara:strand:+ start:678 stop:1094 length:417 start_codon:yes stop_codon:yes gene_type:complete
MVGEAPAPQPIRMTIPAEPAVSTSKAQPDGKKGATSPPYQTSNREYVIWTGISVLVFIIVSIWALSTWWFTELIYFGMLFLHLTFVTVFRANMLQKADPHLQHESLTKNCVMSLIVVIGGYSIAVVLILVFIFAVLLS